MLRRVQSLSVKDGMTMIIRRMVDRLPRIVTGASFIATVNRFDMHSYINDLCVLEPTVSLVVRLASGGEIQNLDSGARTNLGLQGQLLVGYPSYS